MNYELKDILAMDETAVWNDMISNTTIEKRGEHTVNLKSTGHFNCLLNCRGRREQEKAVHCV